MIVLLLLCVILIGLVIVSFRVFLGFLIEMFCFLIVMLILVGIGIGCLLICDMVVFFYYIFIRYM